MSLQTRPTRAGRVGSLESRRGPLRPDDLEAPRRGQDRDRSLRRDVAAALVGRRAGRPVLPRLPQRALSVHRRQGTAGRADGARRSRGRPAVHPAPRRVRARLDARAHSASRRSRGAPRGEELARPARAADPLDGGLHRPRLGRPRDARALERRQPPDHDLLRDADRAALLRAAHRAGRDALRGRQARARSTRASAARPPRATGKISSASSREGPRHRGDGVRRLARGSRDPGRRARRASARPQGLGSRSGARRGGHDRLGESPPRRAGSRRGRPPRRDQAGPARSSSSA